MTIATIVPQTTVTIEAVDALKAAYDVAFAARSAAFDASQAPDATLEHLTAFQAALTACENAYAAWKTAGDALIQQWRDEDVEYDAFLCAQFDAMDNAIDYPEHYDASMPIPYVITTVGHSYLDQHYATHSDASVLAEGGESPYGDGTIGWDQPAPLPSYYQGDTPDLDERDRQEKLSY